MWHFRRVALFASGILGCGVMHVAFSACGFVGLWHFRRVACGICREGVAEMTGLLHWLLELLWHSIRLCSAYVDSECVPDMLGE